MTMDSEYCGRAVRAVYATGDEVCKTNVIGYYSEPTYILEDEDGKEFTWASSLCEPLSAEEEVEYWRDKALEYKHEIEVLKKDEAV